MGSKEFERAADRLETEQHAEGCRRPPRHRGSCCALDPGHEGKCRIPKFETWEQMVLRLEAEKGDLKIENRQLVHRLQRAENDNARLRDGMLEARSHLEEADNSLAEALSADAESPHTGDRQPGDENLASVGHEPPGSFTCVCGHHRAQHTASGCVPACFCTAFYDRAWAGSSP